MPIKIQPVIIGLLLLCFTSGRPAKASIVEDIYDAKVAVADQSDRTQKQAFAKAFKEVLLKVSGNDEVLADPSIKGVVSKAQGFVRAYRYDIQQTQLFLVISFDPQRVDELIRRAGFPIWDKRRPDTLVWLAIKPANEKARQIARATEFTNLYQALSLKAQQRGIRLIFPLWDLKDLQAIGVYDIWGGFSGQIKKASERYDVQSILSARIYLNDNSVLTPDDLDAPPMSNSTELWSADWSMIESTQILAGAVQADNVTKIAEKLIDSLADQLAQKYAINISQSASNQTQVQIVINNIDSLTYYKQALVLLENLSVVSSATLIKQQGVAATFELQLLGEVSDLVNALNLDKKITAVVDDFGQPVGELQFFWVK